mgnify:FL=1
MGKTFPDLKAVDSLDEFKTKLLAETKAYQANFKKIKIHF